MERPLPDKHAADSLFPPRAGESAEPLRAWQPITFRGVAAFAEASFARLLLFQILVAAVSVSSILWFLQTAWEPCLLEAFSNLPNQASLSNGTISWAGPDPVRLAGNRFTSIVLDLHESRRMELAGDLQWEFAKHRLRVRSIFGSNYLPYPADWHIPLVRSELEPWWGAWRPVVFAIIGTTVFAALFVSWWILAALYTLPVRILGFYCDRRMTWGGAWRLSAAALLPGSILMIATILAYGWQKIHLLQLIPASILHICLGWVYLLGAPLRLPLQQLGEPVPAAQDQRRQPSTLPGSDPRNPFSKHD